MGEVVELDCNTILNIPSEKILNAALVEELSSVVVIGYDKNDKLYFSFSDGAVGDVLWLIECAKQKLMTVAEVE